MEQISGLKNLFLCKFCPSTFSVKKYENFQTKKEIYFYLNICFFLICGFFKAVCNVGLLFFQSISYVLISYNELFINRI